MKGMHRLARCFGGPLVPESAVELLHTYVTIPGIIGLASTKAAAGRLDLQGTGSVFLGRGGFQKMNRYRGVWIRKTSGHCWHLDSNVNSLGLFRKFLPLYGYGSIVKAQGTADSAHFLISYNRINMY